MDKLELLFKKDTEITKAEKVIKIDCHHNEVEDSDTVVVDVAKLHELALYQRVTVEVKLSVWVIVWRYLEERKNKTWL